MICFDHDRCLERMRIAAEESGEAEGHGTSSDTDDRFRREEDAGYADFTLSLLNALPVDPDAAADRLRECADYCLDGSRNARRGADHYQDAAHYLRRAADSLPREEAACDWEYTITELRAAMRAAWRREDW